MKQELALVTKEKNVVSQYRDTLAERLDKLNAQIARLQEDNRRLAAQLAQRQLEAVEGPKRSAAWGTNRLYRACSLQRASSPHPDPLARHRPELMRRCLSVVSRSVRNSIVRSSTLSFMR